MQMRMAQMMVLVVSLLILGITGLKTRQKNEPYLEGIIKTINESRPLLKNLKIPDFKKGQLSLRQVEIHNLENLEYELELQKDKLRATSYLDELTINGSFKFLKPITLLLIFQFKPAGRFQLDMHGVSMVIEADVSKGPVKMLKRITDVKVTSEKAKVKAEGMKGLIFSTVVNWITQNAVKSAINSELEQFIMANEPTILSAVNEGHLRHPRRHLTKNVSHPTHQCN